MILGNKEVVAHWGEGGSRLFSEGTLRLAEVLSLFMIRSILWKPVYWT